MKNEALKKKLGSALLVATVMVGAIGGVAGGFATKANAEGKAEEKEDKETVENLATERISSLLNTASGEGKEETVYIFTDSTGKQTKVLVNEKLNNGEAASQIKDVSTLSDILNLSGDEKFTQNGDDLTWDAKGNSITYQGTTTKQAPIDIKVTYTLDGKEISAEDLAGKSGHVAIRFDYTNNEKRTIEVNGKESEACVPFTVVTSMLLSNEHFANVTVENGEASKLTTGTMVMGVALPGLKESLDLNLEDSDFSLNLDFPEYVLVEADTDDCEIDLMLTVASSSLVNVSSLEDINTDNLKEKLEDLEDATEQLSEGTDKLVKGSADLLDGTAKVEDGAKQLADGTGELGNGVNKLSSGVSELSNGISQAKSGSSQVSSGASQVASGASSLASGASQVSGGVDTLVSSVAAMPSKIVESEQSLYNQAKAAGANVDWESDHASGSTASIDAAISAIQAQAGSVDTSAIEAALARCTANGSTTFDEADTSAAVKALMGQGKSQEEATATVGALATAGDYATLNQLAAGYYNAYLQQASAGIAQAGEAVKGLYQIKGAVQALYGVEASLASVDATQLAALKKGASDVADGASSLASGAGKLAEGASALDSGLSKLENGASQLSSGVGELENGVTKLNDGANSLYKGTQDLHDGANKLHDGMVEMQGGVSEFKTEGIDKISELAEEDASNLVKRIKAVIELGSDYKSFAGKADNMEGSVVFVYRLPGIN